jgi:hypothetical protein
MWGTILDIGTGLLSGASGSQAAKRASDVQVAGTDRAIAEQRQQYARTRADNAPFLATGTAANKRLAYLLGIGGGGSDGKGGYTLDDFIAYNKRAAPSWYQAEGPQMTDAESQYKDYNAGKYGTDAETGTRFSMAAPDTGAGGGGYGSLLKKYDLADMNGDPVYQSGLKFGLDEGTKAINSRAISNGGYDSGATMKALTKYGTDYAGTKANDSYNRYTNDQSNIYNKLAGVSGTGQTAANTIRVAGENAANSISESYLDAGNARAAGIVGSANAWGSALTGIANRYQNNRTLQALLAR